MKIIMSNSIEVNISSCIKSPIASSTEDGEIIFKIIDENFSKRVLVNLDFENCELIVSTFLNAAIGQLYANYQPDFIKEHLKVFNMSNDDLRLLQKVVERAKQYFANKEDFGKTINQSLGDE